MIVAVNEARDELLHTYASLPLEVVGKAIADDRVKRMGFDEAVGHATLTMIQLAATHDESRRPFRNYAFNIMIRDLYKEAAAQACQRGCELDDEGEVHDRPDRTLTIHEVHRILRGMTYYEASMVSMRFGLGDGNTKTLDQIANAHGCSIGRVRHILEGAIRRASKREV